MRRGAAFALTSVAAAAATAACDRAPDRVFSVDEVIANIDSLNGKTVRVGGFLPDCDGYNCLLYRNRSAAARGGEGEAEFLGIGDDDDFDNKARPFVGDYVLITGKVDNQCRDKGQWSCLDRGPEVHPTSIKAWRRPAGTVQTPEKVA